MSYTRVNWQDSPSTSTPINAENLNKMDSGISTLDTVSTSIENQIADEYVATNTYAKDSYCLHENAFYKCLEGNVTGTWDSSKWENVTIGDELNKGDSSLAKNVTYDNTSSGAASTNVQGALDEVFGMILDRLYPIGSIYLETTNTNPSSKLGGTWEAYGASDTYLRLGGSGSGGSNTVTLNKNQIPSLTTGNQSASHTHSIPQMRLITSDSTGYMNIGTGGSQTGYTVALATNNTGKLQLLTAPNQSTGEQSASHTHTYTNSSQKTVSITPKYVQVYAWKRTA